VSGSKRHKETIEGALGFPVALGGSDVAAPEDGRTPPDGDSSTSVTVATLGDSKREVAQFALGRADEDQMGAFDNPGGGDVEWEISE